MKFQLRRYEKNDYRVIQVENVGDDETILSACTLHMIRRVLSGEQIPTRDNETLKEMIVWLKENHPEVLL